MDWPGAVGCVALLEGLPPLAARCPLSVEGCAECLVSTAACSNSDRPLSSFSLPFRMMVLWSCCRTMDAEASTAVAVREAATSRLSIDFAQSLAPIVRSYTWFHVENVGSADCPSSACAWIK